MLDRYGVKWIGTDLCHQLYLTDKKQATGDCVKIMACETLHLSRYTGHLSLVIWTLHGFFFLDETFYFYFRLHFCQLVRL